MYVVACIKQVPDTTQVQIDPVSNTLVRDGIPFITNPYDSHALEESLRMKSRYGLRAVALSMGPTTAEATLRNALALGMDEAVLLSDPAFRGADTLSTSNVLAAGIRKLAQADEIGLVFCGRQTIDGDTAQTGPGLAVRLGFSLLTLVDRIEHMDFLSKKIRVRRKLEGRYELVEAKLPALITVTRELNQPRYPTVLMRLKAAEAQIRLWDHKELKLNPETIGLKGSPIRVTKISVRERDEVEILGDGVREPEQTARMLIDRLMARDKAA